MLRLEEEDIYAGIATSGGGGGDTPESAKGSFNASTQQLTLKYDYLVEKINSATWLTDEQKTTTIASLNESDISVVMNDSTLPENPYEYMFVGSENYGITMDITTPVTLKFLITPAYDTPAGFATIGTYKAIADFNTFLGTPMTEEEAEAQYAPFIVDENLCTVSGTLGNFSVEFIEDKPVVEKFGATISTFLGDVDSNGVLQSPSVVDDGIDLVFDGVKDMARYALYGRFTVTSQNNYLNIKSISFPDLEQITGVGAVSDICEYNPHLLSVSFPKLKTVTDSNSSAFYFCQNLKSASLPELEKVSSAGASISNWFGTTALETISFPKLKEAGNVNSSNGTGLSSICSGCRSLTSASLPVLETLGWYGLSNAFAVTALTSMTFPSLKRIRGMYSMQGCFRGTTTLTSLSFPALVTNFFDWQGGGRIFEDLLRGVTGCTVHFPSNLESVISSWSDVTAGFGGTDTTVLFDLPATE